MAKIEAENDRLHVRMGHWRERAGEMKEALESALDMQDAGERWPKEFVEQVRDLIGADERRMRGTAFAEWIKERPPQVQKLAHKFPPGQPIVYEGRELYVVGYIESVDDDSLVGLKASADHPGFDYELALETAVEIYPVKLED